MADNTTLNTGSGGDVIASDDISGVKYQRIKLVHGNDGFNFGDVSTTNPLPVVATHNSAIQAYSLFVPSGAVGANKVYFDLFNATGSGKVIRIHSIKAHVDTDTAVAGTLGVELLLTRTTAVGTGGTAHVENGTTTTAMTITELDSDNSALPAGVTARLAPSGGATGGAVINNTWVFTEETSAATTMTKDLLWPDVVSVQKLTVRENSGIRVLQGSVASVGNIGFNVLFTLE